MSVSKLIVTSARSAEPATLPRTREGFAIKQEQTHLFQEEKKTDAVEVKTLFHPISSSALITFHPSCVTVLLVFHLIALLINKTFEMIRFSPTPPVEQLAFLVVKGQIKQHFSLCLLN